MPVPILLNNPSSGQQEAEMKNHMPAVDYGVDISMLSKALEQMPPKTAMTLVSDFDASLLFKLWREGEESPSNIGTFKVPTTMSNSDILRLKANGLLSGDVDVVTLTDRGKEVIRFIVLASENSLKDGRESRSKPFHKVVAECTRRRRSTNLALARKD